MCYKDIYAYILESGVVCSSLPASFILNLEFTIVHLNHSGL
jgi:hypothetical protein